MTLTSSSGFLSLLFHDPSTCFTFFWVIKFISSLKKSSKTRAQKSTRQSTLFIIVISWFCVVLCCVVWNWNLTSSRNPIFGSEMKISHFFFSSLLRDKLNNKPQCWCCLVPYGTFVHWSIFSSFFDTFSRLVCRCDTFCLVVFGDNLYSFDVFLSPHEVDLVTTMTAAAATTWGMRIFFLLPVPIHTTVLNNNNTNSNSKYKTMKYNTDHCYHSSISLCTDCCYFFGISVATFSFDSNFLCHAATVGMCDIFEIQINNIFCRCRCFFHSFSLSRSCMYFFCFILSFSFNPFFATVHRKFSSSSYFVRPSNSLIRSA